MLLDAVLGVLDEYADHLPLTARQVYYRLVGTIGYDKTEAGYERLLNVLNRARRAELVPFDAIRDDGTTAVIPGGFYGKPNFWSVVRLTARRYRRVRLEGQPVALEVWVEAAGMVPQIARVANPYGVPVYSSGGFDSTTAKYEAAQRIIANSEPTVVLHVGDHDPSGCAVFDSAADDVATMVADLARSASVEFVRVAVTPEQIVRYGLPEAPAKAADKRGTWQGGTVQAEALAPGDLAAEVRQAVESRLDLDVLRNLEDEERTERDQLLANVDRVLAAEEEDSE
ncbi:MAG: hypothetical protein H0U89_07030 [Acidimicrobiia bacterium]|nr:hypothetical protein [Acidimicrobiia bacterium]